MCTSKRNKRRCGAGGVVDPSSLDSLGPSASSSRRVPVIKIRLLMESSPAFLVGSSLKLRGREENRLVCNATDGGQETKICFSFLDSVCLFGRLIMFCVKFYFSKRLTFVRIVVK